MAVRKSAGPESMSDMRARELSGRVALVTGAANGIGRAAAALFAARGADVILADIDPKVIQTAQDIAGTDGVRALGVAMDVRNGDSVEAAVAMGIASFGKIDALANVAGVYPVQRLEELTDAHVQAVLDVNVVGVLRVCRAVAARMRRGGGGAIVNIASGAAFRPYDGLSAYSASKGAVVSMSRVLALELAPRIRVNVVAPGATNTESVRAATSEGQNQAAAAAAAVGIGRMAEPEEIAEAILFLGSDRARFITGQVLPVNGGSFMR